MVIMSLVMPFGLIDTPENTYGLDELSNSTLFGKVCYYIYW